MPILSTPPVMDGENYPHPDGSRLDTTPYSLSNSPLPHTGMENPIYPSSSWGFSQHATYNYPMQSGNQQCRSNPAPDMEVFGSSLFHETDFLNPNLHRNGDFSQACVSSLVFHGTARRCFRKLLRGRICISLTFGKFSGRVL